MNLLDFRAHPLLVNTLVFVVAAAMVWFAGTLLSRYATAIAERTGIAKALIGLLLLGGITSLPEVAVTVSAAAGGDAALGVNNLLGGVAMQVAILAVADVALGREALSSVIVSPSVLLLGTFNILLLVMVAAGTGIGDVAVAGVGLWSSALLIAYIAALAAMKGHRGRQTWTPARYPDDARTQQDQAAGTPAAEASWRQHGDALERRRTQQRQRRTDAGEARGMNGESLPRIVLRTVAAGAAILVAGFLLARTGDAIADKTGLGTSFVGAVFVAISTSLPEVSTVMAAVRLRQYEMAVADIFGTNLADVGLIFVVDAVYAGGPVLSEVGRFSLFAALLGIAVTTLYVAGFIERRDRTVLRMGLYSFLVLLVYAGGLIGLYHLR